MSAELSSLTPLANHLWQSTIFVGVICLLTLAFKKNRAAVRYWLWFAASVKFLLPFSFLVALGSRLSWRSGAPIAQPQWSFVVDNAIQPFAASTAPPQIVSQHVSFPLVPILIAVWLCGATVGLVFWLKCWLQMRRIRKNATPLSLGLPIPVLLSPSRIEPGVFGIFRPVLLLPDGIESRLTPAQLDAIVAHEMAHVRRRDNLTAAMHMIVEIIFWFFPVVYWLRARLIEERENACDEAVVSTSSEPESYAEGIIEVCKSYAESPAACISGISGSDLQKRVIRILSHHLGKNLTHGKKLALALASAALAVAPLVVGFLNAPLLHAQSATSPADWEKAAGGKMSFDVASIKQDTSGKFFPPKFPLSPDDSYPGNMTLFTSGLPLDVDIAFAYKTRISQQAELRSQLPRWAQTEKFDIDARAAVPSTKDQMRLMMQSLLEDRFKLKVHFETRGMPAFALVLVNAGKMGPQLRPYAEEPPCNQGAAQWHAITPGGKVTIGEFPAVCYTLGLIPTTVSGTTVLNLGSRNVSMQQIADDMAAAPNASLGRPVVDRTGLSGNFDFLMSFAAKPPLTTDPNVPADSAPTFLEALKDQLGLKLESTTALVTTLVIDHIEEPTPN